MATLDEYLEIQVTDGFKRQLEQEENILRSLPFFVTALCNGAGTGRHDCRLRKQFAPVVRLRLADERGDHRGRGIDCDPDRRDCVWPGPGSLAKELSLSGG